MPYNKGQNISFYVNKELFTATILKVDYHTQSYVVDAVYGIDLNKVDPRLSTIKKLLTVLLPVFPNGRKDYRCLHKVFER